MTELQGPVVGFRVWWAVQMRWQRPPLRDGRLQSIGSQFLWTSATVVANCDKHKAHTAPAPGCDCGLYAYDRLATARLHEEELRTPFSLHFGGILVLGAVLLWGHLIRAEVADCYANRLSGSDLGLRFRAQFGRVLALRDDGQVTELACLAHGIPAVQERYLESFAREHGAQVRTRRPARDAGRNPPLRRLEEGLIRGYLDGSLGWGGL